MPYSPGQFTRILISSSYVKYRLATSVNVYYLLVNRQIAVWQDYDFTGWQEVRIIIPCFLYRL
jgi:hypothetical protein